MVDSANNTEPAAVPVVEEAPKKAGFLASTTGKLVVGGIALVLVLGAAAVIAFIFLFSTTGQQPGTSTTSSGGQSGAASASTTSAAPIVEPEKKPLSSTFTFRNIFAPTIEPPAPAAETTGTTPDIPADTLYLESIQTANGEKTATFIWNGQSYTVGEGDTIGDSPWKVLEIGSESVLLLYGDTQVTLSLGQGVTK